MIATADKPKAAKGTIPAVGYVRMSSKQQDASPEQQRAEITKLAERLGYNLIRWYFDPGITGDDTRKRKQFLRMMHDAENKRDFAVIVCWDQDRFGRFDSVEAGRWIFPLREAGIWLATVAQGVVDWNTFQGRLIYSVQQEGKHQYLIDLSRNVLRGKVASAQKGNSASNPPFAYDRFFHDENGKPACRIKYGDRFHRPKGWTMRFVLSEDSAIVATARWIWKAYVETDLGITSIARDLNRRGVDSPTGKKWSVETVEGILTNRVYTGANVFGRNRYGKYHHLGEKGETVEGRPQKHCTACPIITEDRHDALIDQEMFDRAQQKLASRRQKHHRTTDSPYLLSELIRCGHCGGTMAGRGYNAKGSYPKRYYTCATAGSRPGECKYYQIPKEAIETYILAKVEERFFEPIMLKQIEAAIHKHAKSEATFQDAAKALQQQIATLDRKIAKGSENLLLANVDDMDDLSRLLGEWRKERARLQTELQHMAAEAGGKSPEERAEKALAELMDLQRNFRSDDPGCVRVVLQSIIENIELWFEPYGKQKRILKGVLRFRPELQISSMACRGR
jgi:site-specific DNA recombinase